MIQFTEYFVILPKNLKIKGKNFLFSKGVTQFKLVTSLGATETYPFIGSSEIISDITSTGKTLRDNELRVLKDGIILNSTACLLYSKKLKKKIRF